MYIDFTTPEWHEQVKNLPKLDDLKVAFEEFSNSDFAGKSFEEVDKFYFSKINLYPGQHFNLTPEQINEFSIFRVRNNLNIETENIQLINTFSFPPPAFCNSNGRAHLAKYPVFYCSDNLGTSFLEVKPKAGETLFMSFWEIKCDREATFVPILINNLPQESTWRPTADILFEEMVKHCNEVGLDKIDELIYLYNQFSSWFVTETEPYYRTSWIAHKHLYRTNNLDFVLYPSFVSDQLTCSMAFHPNFVTNFFRLKEVISYKIIQIEGHTAEVLLSMVGTPSLTNINWRKARGDDYKKMGLIKN